MSGTSLISPGVALSIVDETSYSSAGPGTVPLIVMVTAKNKVASSGTGIAPMTDPAQAGKLYVATSQRDLIQSFGNPTFVTVQGTALFGDELNEYGLHAAYSFLGLANQCYVIRANLNLDEMTPAAEPPVGPPVAGTYWLNLSTTSWGLFQSNGAALPGNAWSPVPVLVATGSQIDGNNKPLTSFGVSGNFAVVPETASNYMFQKIGNTWYQIGTTAWNAALPTTVTGVSNPQTIAANSTFGINGITVHLVANPSALSDVVTAINAAAIANIHASASPANALIISNTIGGPITLVDGAGTLAKLGLVAGTTNGNQVVRTSSAGYPANSVSGDLWVKYSAPNNGANWVVNYYNGQTAAFVPQVVPFYPFSSQLTDGNAAKDTAAIAALGNPVAGTVYVGFDLTTGDQSLRRWSGTSWSQLVYEADSTAPSTPPSAGTLYFNSTPIVDVMVSNGNQWIGYHREYPATDPNGVQLSATPPTFQSNGSTALAANDLWIDTSDTENYPLLYRWDAVNLRWRLIDLTDHTTPFGLVFGDARNDSGTTFTGIPNAGAYAYNSTLPSDLALSDFVAPDAPSPYLYPAGTILFNTRLSTNNVKSWQPTYFLPGGFDPNTDYTHSSYTVGNPAYTFPALSTAGVWVTASGNDTTGVAYMGRKAQRIMAVEAMASVFQTNQDIRSELVNYNLIAAPGYVELLPDMVTLNTDQKNFSFIVGDTPLRLPSDGNSLNNWATNALNVASDGEDGLVTHNPYIGIYYPWGLGVDAGGNEVMIPPSTIALRTIAYSDSVAYPWFAPAGFQRGLVTNATTVGYLDSNGAFVPVILNQGQRDVLYSNNINPIAYIPGRGLVVFGQKTLNPLTTALDRINVARLCNYLSYQLDHMMLVYLFTQNDNITRAEAKNTVERFLNELIGKRAITDYLVVCDTSNNTPDRIDQNELWIDVLIVPDKVVEFIYIPVRLENTGTNLNSLPVS